MTQTFVNWGTPWFLHNPEAASQLKGALHAVAQAELPLLLEPELELEVVLAEPLEELLPVVELLELAALLADVLLVVLELPWVTELDPAVPEELPPCPLLEPLPPEEPSVDTGSWQ